MMVLIALASTTMIQHDDEYGGVDDFGCGSNDDADGVDDVGANDGGADS